MNNSSCEIVLLGQQCFMNLTTQSLKDFASLFYLLDINSSIKDRVEDVPNYEILLFPTIGILIFLEQLARVFQRKRMTRFEDILVNLGSMMLFTLWRIFLYVTVIRVFNYLHTNFRIVDLPLHSVTTWLISLLLVEFFYYWTHRAMHEVNFLWAAHQFHHTAEDVNITVTGRNSMVDLVIYDLIPIPLALIVPPPILALHIQFSLLYQVWIHNEVVGNLGPLEYIVNTPRQHRVHHGKNPYCIDKNYGALLMIWDRIFGTYQKEEDKIVFGSVAPQPKHFDPIRLQLGYYVEVAKKVYSMDTFSDKLSALFKGPGWTPGKPRLGLLSDVPEPDPDAPRHAYTPEIALWKKVYVYIHSFTILMGFYMMADHPLVRFSPMKGLISMFYVLLALTSFGAIFDGRWYAIILEIFRCLVYYAFDYYLIAFVPWPLERSIMKSIFFWALWAIRAFHALSILFWIGYFLLTSAVRCLYPKSGHFNENVINFSSSSTEKIKPASIDGSIDGVDSVSEATTISKSNLQVETGSADSKSGVFKILFNLKATTVMIMLTLGFFSASTVSFLYFSKVESCSKFLDALVEEVF